MDKSIAPDFKQYTVPMIAPPPLWLKDWMLEAYILQVMLH